MSWRWLSTTSCFVNSIPQWRGQEKEKEKKLRRLRKKIGKRSGFLDMLIGHKGKQDLAVEKAWDGYKNQILVQWELNCLHPKESVKEITVRYIYVLLFQAPEGNVSTACCFTEYVFSHILSSFAWNNTVLLKTWAGHRQCLCLRWGLSWTFCTISLYNMSTLSIYDIQNCLWEILKPKRN